MKITIWDKTITLDDDIVQKYRSFGNKVDEAECRYLVKTSDIATSGSTPEEIKNAIESGMKHTFTVESDIPKIIKAIQQSDGSPC